MMMNSVSNDSSITVNMNIWLNVADDIPHSVRNSAHFIL